MIGLIVSTYKSPDFLNLVLESVDRQKLSPDEIIVTEDGRLEANRTVISEWQKRLAKKPGAPALIHLSQEDLGNRKPLALNRAIATAKSDYLIFIDGDCVLRSDFIEAHMELRGPEHFLTGRRVELSEKASISLTAEGIRKGYLDSFPWGLAWDSIFGKTQNLGRLFRTPRFLRSLLGRDHIDDIRGCNFSVERRHLVEINGFSNDFSGAYGEDSDVEHRLRFHGIEMKSVKGAAIQYHLWHPTQNKDPLNQVKLGEVLKQKMARTPNGLSEIGHFS